MSEIRIRAAGRAGWITLARPDALNALTAFMCSEIERSLDQWNDGNAIDLIIIDAEGQRAFCAGGDIVEMYRSGQRGDFDYGRRFWRNEYRLNAKLANSRLPVVTFLQGFTMGGGVGIGCHASHRIVGESSRVAMPECAIGLVPDVGGSYLLSRAPGRIGECMAVSGTRANAADALNAGLADSFVPEDRWEPLKESLARTGDLKEIGKCTDEPPAGEIQCQRKMIDEVFSLPGMNEIIEALERRNSGFASKCLKSIGRNSPLSMACALSLVRLQRKSQSIEEALALEYRYVHRAVEHTDFIEGIRAMVIDKDNRPKWKHANCGSVEDAEVDALLGHLGEEELEIER